MTNAERAVFISYRRANAPWALAIFQSLTKSGLDVFFDFKSIASGDFEHAILENTRSRPHFLVLLTPSSLERCNEPSDWFRREIEEALASRRNIIPIMLDGFGFDAPWISTQLPDAISALTAYNAITIPIEYFDAAMERLRFKFLQVPLDAVVHPASNSSRTIVEESREAALLAPLVREITLTAQQYLERGVTVDDDGIKFECFNEAIRLQPDFAEAYYERGGLYEKRDDFNHGEDFDKALADYNEAIRNDTDHDRAYAARAGLYEASGKFKLALKDRNEVIRITPYSAWAYWNRGRVLTELDQLQRALSSCDLVLFAKNYPICSCRLPDVPL